MTKGGVVLFCSATLDLFFARADELMKGVSDEVAWWIFDYSTFFRILSLVLTLFYFLIFEEKPRRSGIIWFAVYHLANLTFYYFWIRNQYNMRFL